jgi:pimeloyl-ACP methyl ester carboxylesterase
MTNNIKFITNPRGQKLGFIKNEISSLTCVWLCGYHSDFSGSKAQTVAETAKENGVSSLLFDYSGTGVSEGNFEDGTISKWLQDTEFMIEQQAKGDLIFLGSSMGGWLSLLFAIKHPERVKALILLAPAPDFTSDLMWDRFPKDAQEEMLKNGYWLRETEYDENGYKVTLDLIDDGKKHLILHDEINIDVPVKIIHGMNDTDVPYERSIELMHNLKTNDVHLYYIKDGNHRLSNEGDLQLLKQTLKATIKNIGSQ